MEAAQAGGATELQWPCNNNNSTQIEILRILSEIPRIMSPGPPTTIVYIICLG